MDLYVRLLRIKCQSKMLIKTTKEYNRRINEIIEGDFDSEILKVSEASKLRDVFKELSVYNFSNIKVLKCELLGQEVLSYLLNTFYNALFSKEICLNGKLNRKSKEFKIYSLISKIISIRPAMKEKSFLQIIIKIHVDNRLCKWYDRYICIKFISRTYR